MNFAPYQWRAGKGYLPPPDHVPAPVIPSPMYYYPHGPVPANGVFSGGQWPGPYFAVPPPAKQPSVASTPAPGPPPAPKKEEKSKKVVYVIDKSIASLPSIAPGESSTGGPPPKPKSVKTVAHSTNDMAPPTMRPGVNYMYPREHTMLHVFSKAAPVWEEKYKGQKLQFKIFKVFTGMTVASVIERVLKQSDAEKCKGWVVTEVFERGEGEWRKGTTIAYDGDKAKGTLASMGWNKRRGEDLQPVWLAVHKSS